MTVRCQGGRGEIICKRVGGAICAGFQPLTQNSQRTEIDSIKHIRPSLCQRFSSTSCLRDLSRHRHTRAVSSAHLQRHPHHTNLCASFKERHNNYGSESEVLPAYQYPVRGNEAMNVVAPRRLGREAATCSRSSEWSSVLLQTKRWILPTSFLPQMRSTAVLASSR